MTTSTVQDALDAPWWPELLSVKDTASWAVLAQRFAVSANTLRAALASSGHTKAPMAPGRKPKAAKSGSAVAAKPAVVVDPLMAVRSRIGTAPDAEIASLAGVAAAQVKAYRNEHGIAAFKKAPPGAPPARAPGRDRTVVRRRDGADTVVVKAPAAPPVAVAPPVVPAPAPAPRKPRVERPRRAAAPAAPARAKGRPGRRSAIDAFADLLGTVADAELAARAKVTVAAVTQYRLRRGIPAANRRPAVSAGSDVGARHRRSKLDAHVHLVGVLSDAEVALLAGVTSEGVRQYRRRHGIPSAWSAAAADAPAPRASASAAPRAPARAAPRAPAPPVPRVAPPRAPAPPAPRSAELAAAPIAAVPAQASVVAPVAAAPVAVTDQPGTQAYGVMAVRGTVSRRFVVVGTDLRDSVRRASAALEARADGPWVIRSVRALCDVLG